VTHGPGLSGSLMVGPNYAKGLSWRATAAAADHHLEGHVYSNWLIADPNQPLPEPPFPLLVLIVSGGHTELLLMREHWPLSAACGTAMTRRASIRTRWDGQLGLGFPRRDRPSAGREGYLGHALTCRAPGCADPGLQFSAPETAVWQLLEPMLDRSRNTCRASAERPSPGPSRERGGCPTTRLPARPAIRR